MLVLCGLLLTGCGDPADDLPTAHPCTPDVPPGVDPSAGASFSPNHLLCVRVTMPQADFDKLRIENRFGVPEDEVVGELFSVLTDSCTEPYPQKFNWYAADVDIDGVKLAQVGVRKKGFLGSVIGTGSVKPSIKIKTDKHKDGQLLGETERLTLNNNAQDRTRMSTCLAYQAFTAAGYPAPRCNLAVVMVNGKSLGAYVHVESIKRRFLKRVFGDDTGSLYEGAVADFTSAALASAASGQLGRWQVKTSKTDVKGAGLRRVLTALMATDEQLESALSEVVDLALFSKFWALEVAVGHGDGYSSNRNNFYVYFDPGNVGPTGQRRAVFIPWGADNVLGGDGGDKNSNNLDSFVHGELARRMSHVPALRKRLEDALAEVLQQWDAASLVAQAGVFAELVRKAQDDPGHGERLAVTTRWIEGRKAHLQGLLKDGVPKGPEAGGDCGGLPGADNLGEDLLELIALWVFLF